MKIVITGVVVAGAIAAFVYGSQALAAQDAQREVDAKHYEACVVKQWGHSVQWVYANFGTYPPCN